MTAYILAPKLEVETIASAGVKTANTELIIGWCLRVKGLKAKMATIISKTSLSML